MRTNIYSPFRMILVLYGFVSIRSHVYVRVLSRISACLLSFALVLTIYTNLLYSFKLLNTLTYFPYYCLCLSVLMHLIKNRIRIEKLIKNFNDQLDYSKHPKLTKLSKTSVALLIVYTLCDIGLQLVFAYNAGLNRFIEKSILVSTQDWSCVWKTILVMILTTFGCMIGGLLMMTWIMIYNFTIYTIGEIRISIIDGLLQNEKNSANHDVLRIHSYWLEIESAVNEFDRTFSMFPFIWFVILFYKSCFHLILLKSQSFMIDIPMAINYVWFVVEYLATMSILFTIDRVNKQTQRSFESYRKRFIRSKMSGSASRELNNDIEKQLNLKLTAWSMFELNKSFILSFISSLITFSVLFMQLSNAHA